MSQSILYDKSGIDIQPFRVFIKGENFFREMVYTNNQQFGLYIPEGIYNIVLNENVGEVLPYKRANLFVPRNKTTILKIDRSESQGQVCDKKFGVEMIPNDAPYDETYEKNAPKYDEIPVNGPYNSVIKYCRKQEDKNNRTYRFATVTYKNMAVYSGDLKFDKRRFILEATEKRRLLLIEINGRQQKKIKFALNEIKPGDS